MGGGFRVSRVLSCSPFSFSTLPRSHSIPSSPPPPPPPPKCIQFQTALAAPPRPNPTSIPTHPTLAPHPIYRTPTPTFIPVHPTPTLTHPQPTHHYHHHNNPSNCDPPSPPHHPKPLHHQPIQPIHPSPLHLYPPQPIQVELQPIPNPTRSRTHPTPPQTTIYSHAYMICMSQL